MRLIDVVLDHVERGETVLVVWPRGALAERQTGRRREADEPVPDGLEDA